MGTSKIGISAELSAKQILDRRSQIWKEFGRTSSDIVDLNSYSNIYGNANITEELFPITSENTPPTEIAATIVKLVEQQAIITRAKAEIKADLVKIAETKSQFIKVAIVTAAIVLAIVIFLVIKSSR